MKAKVYGIPGSAPVKAAMLMLEHKGIGADRIDLPNAASRAIARALDELRPDPPLFPSDPALRTRVEDAERWGDEVFQMVPRRLSFSTPILRHRSDFAGFFEGPLLGMPPRVAMAFAAPLLMASARLNKATDDAVRADLAALPGMLGHVDALIAEGVIGGADPNAADFQIASNLRLLMCFDDIRPAIAGRPAARLANEVVPSYPGHVRPALPPDWVALLRPAA